MGFKRADRVSEAIKREISVLILREVKDPDVAGVTVTAVETSDDLRHANVFVSVMGGDDEKKRTLEGLARARGYLRSEVSHRVELRYAPELHFQLDRSLDHAMKIESILNQIKAKPAESIEGPEPPEDGPPR